MVFTVNIEHVSPKNWNENLLLNSKSTTYQTSNWLSVYNDAYDSQPLFLTVEDSSGTKVAQMAASIHDRYFWADASGISKKIGTKFHLRKNINWNYGPIVFDNAHYNEIIEKIISNLDEFAIANNITSITGIFPPSRKIIEKQPATSILKIKGYQNLRWGTYILNLDQNISELFDSYDKKTRYDIRKSERENLEFKVVENFEELEKFRLLKIMNRDENNKRSVSEKQGVKYYEELWKHLYNNNLEKMFFVIKDGTPISGMRVIIFNKNIIQFAVVNQSRLKTMAGTFLTWNVIKWAKENNFINFDLGGVNPSPNNSKEKQIDYFKAKWGGQLCQYIRCNKTLNYSKMKISSFLKKT